MIFYAKTLLNALNNLSILVVMFAPIAHRVSNNITVDVVRALNRSASVFSVPLKSAAPPDSRGVAPAPASASSLSLGTNLTRPGHA